MQYEVVPIASGAIDFTFTPGFGSRIKELRIHCTEGVIGSGEASLQVDSAQGSEYDAYLYRSNTLSVQDIAEIFDGEGHILETADAVRLRCANPANRTLGAIIVWEKI